MCLFQTLVLSALVASVVSHGRVLEPPSRASAWRYGFDTPPDYDDDGANCGGFSHQWSNNGGRCGICGDPYDHQPPRVHELGGRYGVGVIVSHYQPGSLFPITVELTAYHRGFWEFKLCPDPENNEQYCFENYVLELEDGNTKYYPKLGSTKYSLTYRLPAGLVCDHCVLQWRYTAGNNWGVCANGTSGLGCGNQEQFGACSDISIGTRQYNDLDSNIPPEVISNFVDLPQGLFLLLQRGSGMPKTYRAAVKPRKKNKHSHRKKKSRKKAKYRKRKKRLFWI